MKKSLLLLVAVIGFSVSAQEIISSGEAAAYIGDIKTVCGKAVQTVSKKGYTYVNFGNRYPRQNFHLFITTPEKYNNLYELTNKEVCAFGKIESYRNKPEITNPEQLYIR